MIDEVTIESDERGFSLCLLGDFTTEFERYLAEDASTVVLRLPQDAAIQLLAQANVSLGPWHSAMVYERDAFNRASEEDIEEVLGGAVRAPATDAALEAGDRARKIAKGE